MTMKQLKAADAELSGRIKDLQKQKSDVYEKMKLLATCCNQLRPS
jgi:hypothetical protein